MSPEKQPGVIPAGFFRPSKQLQPRKLVTPVETLEVIADLRKLELSGKLKEAEAGYRNLLSGKSPHWMAYHRLGVLYALRQQSSQSQDMFQKAIKINPNNADLLCDAGFQAQRIGDWETARSLYQQALRLDARHSRSHNHLAVLLVSDDSIDAARQHFRLAGLSDAEVEGNVSAAAASIAQSSR